MKIKTPEKIQMFKCTSGPPVESLPLWKRAELDTKLRLVIVDEVARACAVESLVNDAEDYIAILWFKEKGRPNGAKDKKPRVKRVAETAAQKAA